MAIGQAAIVEQLKQDIKYIVVRLFDFIEKNHAVGASSNRFRQLATFFVTDVSRRGAYKSTDGVPFHELAHVDSNHGGFIVEHNLRQRFAKFCFSDAGGAQKQERANRSVGIAEAATTAPHGITDRNHRKVLTDDTLMQSFFHQKKFGAFGFQHAGHRDSGPRADHGGDFIGCHLGPQQLGFVPFGFYIDRLIPVHLLAEFSPRLIEFE